MKINFKALFQTALIITVAVGFITHSFYLKALREEVNETKTDIEDVSNALIAVSQERWYPVSVTGDRLMLSTDPDGGGQHLGVVLLPTELQPFLRMDSIKGVRFKISAGPMRAFGNRVGMEIIK